MSITVLATGFPTDFFHKDGDFKEGVPTAAKQISPKPVTRFPTSSVARRSSVASDSIFDAVEENVSPSTVKDAKTSADVDDEEEVQSSDDKKNRGIRGFFKRLLQ